MIFKGFGKTADVNERAIIRRVRPDGRVTGEPKKIYLTFDDGPDALGTPAVLEILAKHQVRATFFVIADKISAQKNLLEQTKKAGHAFGNHSLNHHYGIFLKSEKKMSEWFEQARHRLIDFGVSDAVGFRPPAGLCTPPLFTTLKKHDEPLILWSHRFFDTQVTWTERRMRVVLPQLRDGDILLLHDRQRQKSAKKFCATLDLFISESAKSGFQCAPLSRELCQKQAASQQRNN